MIPREHGAYAELLFPMVSVFLGGSPTAATWLMAVAAGACFLANEPLLVLFGGRGSRARRERGARARRTLLAFGIVALAAGLLAVWQAPPSARLAVALPSLMGAGVGWMAIRGRERSRFGETLAAATLSSIALPLGLTAGLSVGTALAVTLVWLVVALLATAAVQLTVYETRAKAAPKLGRARAMRAVLFVVGLIVVAVGLALPFVPGGPGWVVAAAAPVALLVTGIAIAKPTARNLRPVGWSFVVANLCSLIAVVVALRAS